MKEGVALQNGKLNFVSTGDLACPFNRTGLTGNCIALNFTNNSGIWDWEPQVSKLISKTWPKVPIFFEAKAELKEDSELGDVQFIKVESGESGKLWIANVIIFDKKGSRFVLSMKSLKRSLLMIAGVAKWKKASVHLRLEQLQGLEEDGNKDKVLELIKECFQAKAVPVFIYHEPKEQNMKKRKRDNVEEEEEKAQSTDAEGKDTKRSKKEEKTQETKETKSKSDETKIMSGVSVVLAVRDPTLLNDLKDKVLKMGGQVNDRWMAHGPKASTHLVCSDASSAIVKHVDNLGAKIVNENWIVDSFNEKRKLKERPYYTLEHHLEEEDEESTQASVGDDLELSDVESGGAKQPSHRRRRGRRGGKEKEENKEREEENENAGFELPSVFDGWCNVVVNAKVENRDELCRYLIAYGAVVEQFVSDETSHVIVPAPFHGIRSKQSTKDNRTALCYVSPSWAWDCINTKQHLPEENYTTTK